MASDFGEMADRIADLRDTHLPEAHEEATDETMGDLQDGVTAEIRKGDSVARGVLVSDVQHNTRDGSASHVTVQTVNVPEWAKYLEHGTGQRGRRDTLPDHESYTAPSPMPPFERILTWVVEKNVTPSADGPYESQIELATAIQQRIGDVGTFPHPFLRPVWYGTRGYRAVVRANERAIARALRRF